jgi:glycosyltransferase involved in cell wall biosynthesis
VSARLAEEGARGPAVSVIIPTCDRGELLRRALASVRAQTLPPAEIIVVDDGSDEAARPRVDADVRLVVNTHARGASGARNCGAATARGTLLAFLDDDDEWLPAYLATALAQIAADRLDVLCTDLLYRYEEDGSERPGKQAPAALDAQAFLTHNPGLVGSNLVIRAAVYAALGGFDESLLTAEDMDFGIRLSLHGGLRYAPLRERLVAHHHHRRPRLCTRRGEAMRAGIRRFFALHEARMDGAQRDAFRQAMQRLWGIDEFGRDLEPPP